jgi:hypothetical protein
MITKITTILNIEEETEMIEGMAETDPTNQDIETTETMIDVVITEAPITIEVVIDKESSTKILIEELVPLIDQDPEKTKEGMKTKMEQDQGSKGTITIIETTIEKFMVPLRRDMITSHNIEDHNKIMATQEESIITKITNMKEDATIIDIIAIEETIETKIDAITEITIEVEIETTITVTTTVTIIVTITATITATNLNIKTNIELIDRTIKLQTITRKIQEMT